MTAGFGFGGRGGAPGNRQIKRNVKVAAGKRYSIISNVNEKAAKAFDTNVLNAMVPRQDNIAGEENPNVNIDRPQQQQQQQVQKVLQRGPGAGRFAGIGAVNAAVDGGIRVKLTPDGVIKNLQQVSGNLPGGRNVDRLDPNTPRENIFGFDRPGANVPGGNNLGKIGQVVRENVAPNRVIENAEDVVELTPREKRAVERGEPPVPPEESEDLGNIESMALNEDEKPRILAVIEEGIKTNGSPEQITLIIKKLSGNRFRAISYTIFKKNIFTDVDYDEGAEITTFRTRGNYKYFQAINNAGLTYDDVFTYTDRSIRSGRVYAYKVKVKYDDDLDQLSQGDLTPLGEAISEAGEAIVAENLLPGVNAGPGQDPGNPINQRFRIPGI